MTDFAPVQQHHLQQRLALMAQLNPLAVIEWNINFEVVAWNPAAERIFGYCAAEVMGRSSLDLIVPEEYRQSIAQTLQELMQQRQGSLNRNQNITKEGCIILCEWYNTPLMNESGDVIGIISMAQDITEREQIAATLRQTQKELETRVEQRTAELKQTVAQLQQEIQERQQIEAEFQTNQQLLENSESSYRALLKLIPDLIMRLKRDGTYLDFMPAADFCVVGARDPIGLNLKDSLPLELVQLRMGYIEQAFQTGETQIYEQKIEINGETHTEEIRIVVSGADEVVVIVRDVSESARLAAERQEAENQLKDSRRFLQLIIDNIPQKIFWKDIDSVYLGCNQGAAKDVGLAHPAEIIGKTDYDLALPKEQVDSYRAEDRRVMSKSVAELHVTSTQKLADGQTIWIDASKIPLLDEQGNVIGILGTYEDITERKRSEAALQETLKQTEYQSQLLRTVLDTSPDWIFVKDDSFRYLMVNQSFREAMGKPMEQILGRDDLKLGCSEELIYGNPQRQIRGYHNIDQMVIQGETFYDPCSPITTADGISRVFETKKVPLRDAQGQIFGVLGISRDITDRHQAEQQLKTSQTFLNNILDGIPDPIFVKDEQHRWILMNRAFCEMLGREREWLMGKSDYDISQKEHADVFLEKDDLVLRTETENVNEEYHSDSNGNIRFLATKKSCFRDTEGNKFLIGVIRDISNRKASEEALRQSEAQFRQQTEQLQHTLQELQQAQSQLVQSEKMSSLGQLVAGVSHEINNPVSFIYGNLKHVTLYTQDLLSLVQLYQEAYPDPLPTIQKCIKTIELEYLVSDLPKLLKSMKVGADRIQEIVRSLRIFSRMDEAEMKAVDIHEGLDSTLMILQNRIKAQAHRPAIAILKAYGELPLIECYAGQLNQVFMNILGNAIDALEEATENEAWAQKNLQIHDQKVQPDEEAEPYLELIIETLLIDSERVKICIRDNGLGIGKEDLKKLFNPFFTTKPVGKGTGMGLSISYQIITEKHGGTLQCFSELGQGAEFVIMIPIQQPDGEAGIGANTR